MSADQQTATGSETGTEHVDVLIVGAGLSGIGAAARLERDRPGTTYTVLERRSAMGGTWDLFRYPGVRSDTGMYTFSYPFRPWRGETSMGQGDDIRAYIRATAAEHWTVQAESAGVPVTRTCSFLYLCAGYYDYDRGHQPDFAGLEDYAGEFVHPQFWPEGLDDDGKRVVVIGSGATAVTLIPSMTDRAAHVDVHFKPDYEPWDQRLTLAPDGDFYAAIARGDASVVTGHIDRFVAEGIRLESGETVPADVVVCATGLRMQALGGIELAVDGRPVDPADTVALRADLTTRFVLEVIGHMQDHGDATAVACRPTSGETRPFIDDLNSSYIQRGVHRFPQQGDRAPWKIRQNFFVDAAEAQLADLTRGIDFGHRTAAGEVRATPVAAGTEPAHR